MNILSMLVRLEDALGRTNLSKQMVLLSPLSSEEGYLDSESLPSRNLEAGSSLRKSRNINLVVGYNGSPRSQTALDLTLWIAHQTRLATRHQVTVQVVYVVDLEEHYGQAVPAPTAPDTVPAALGWFDDQAFGDQAGMQPLTFHDRARRSGRTAAIGSAAIGTVAELPSLMERTSGDIPQIDQFDYADRVLWQARQMADEWRGALKTHLRFGNVAQELRRVVNAEAASVLLLGCTSADNRVVEELGLAFPCTVLGIPPTLD
jgi:nucleotide-binding universal stress UspA family protein